MIRSTKVAAVWVTVALSGVAFAGEKTTGAKKASLNDAQIAHIAVTANQIDIDAAKDALGKTDNPQVKQFAQQMITDHQSVIDKANALATKLNVTPEENETSKKLQEAADKEKERLSNKAGSAFDRAYVEHEVAYHKQVIETVDKVLVPNTKNKELKSLLTSVKPVLNAHLEHAKSLEKQLSSKTGTGGAGKAGTSGSEHEHGSKTKKGGSSYP